MMTTKLLEYVRPELLLDHYTQITPELLQEKGLKALIIDIDNTLIPYGTYSAEPSLELWVERFREANIPIYLLSNASHARAKYWTSSLRVRGIGLAGKPDPMAFKRVALLLGVPPARIAVAGDQLFTDVLGARLAGMHPFLVRPLVPNSLPHTKLVRHLERLLLSLWDYRW